MHTPETDPNKLMGRPGQYVAKITWSARGEDATLEVFETLPAALARAEYVRKIGSPAEAKGSPPA